MKRNSIYILSIIFITLCIFGTLFVIQRYIVEKEARAAEAARSAAISAVIENRLVTTSTSTDPFGSADKISILFIGLDTRAGSTISHCDAIQLIEIDQSAETVHITAVPRGTYANLPPGTGTTSSDYYVSNSCALGGLDYGIKQIERILGVQADYIVMIGFSELVGALRTLRLPTTDTVQWLRHRQGYAIGEPQRARNHSTFLKQMLVRYTPQEIRTSDTALHYILYSFVSTELSFAQVRSLIQTLSDMRLFERPEAITLRMRPAYEVQDIAYDETTAGEYVAQMVGPIARYLNPSDYQSITEEEITAHILTQIEESKADPALLMLAWEQKWWYQIYDETTRLEAHYELLLHYLETLETAEERQDVLGDYVLEMEFLGYDEWAEQGKALIIEALSV